MNPGAGSRVGRCNTLPRARVKPVLSTISGGDDVDRPAHLRVIERVEDEPHHVVDVDPGHALSPVAQAAGHAHAEGRQHLRERAAVPGEDDADAQQHHPQTEGLRLAGFVLPGLDHAGQEVRARRCALVEEFLIAVAIVAHRRCRQEHARARLGGGDTFYQVARPEHAAVADEAFTPLVPASCGHGLPRQVDHHVGAVERRARCRLGQGIPGMAAEAELLVGTRGIAGQDGERVAVRPQGR